MLSKGNRVTAAILVNNKIQILNVPIKTVIK